jgi:ABC-type Na+ efflux pump permease subunit
MNGEPVTMTENQNLPSQPVVPDREWVGFSPGRVVTIAANTLTESMRQKVYNILLLFALVVIASASFFAQFSFGETAEQVATEQLKFIKDFCLGAISVFGMLIAIVGTAQLIPNEVESRTIYTILSKPVRRFEFLLGKYMGSVFLILLSIVMMSLLFGAMLCFKERRLTADAMVGASQSAPGTEYHEDMQRLLPQIHRDAYDPDIVKGVLLTFVKLSLLAAITLLVSTFSTSMIFNVTVGFLVFFAGHLVGTAREIWADSPAARYLLAIVPDLSAFNVTDDIVLGNAIPWWHVIKVAVYGVVYLTTVVAAAHFIFSDREI